MLHRGREYISSNPDRIFLQSYSLPIITVKATAGKFLSGLFKSTMKDADGNAVVDFSRTAKELVEETLDDAGKVVIQKLKDGLTEDQLKQVVYKTKNSPFKIGIAIAVGLAAVALVAKNMMDKKKAEAAEAEAEAAEAAAPEVESEAEAVSEAEETPEEE